MSRSPAASRLMYVAHSDLHCADAEAISGMFRLLKHPKLIVKNCHGNIQYIQKQPHLLQFLDFV